MKIIRFKECNSVYAENQPEYISLPVYKSSDGRVTSCWEMSFFERLYVLITGKIYFTLMTFNKPLQPQRASLKKALEGKE